MKWSGRSKISGPHYAVGSPVHLYGFSSGAVLALMGDRSVPAEVAGTATMPALILVGSESPDLKHEAAAALVRAMSRSKRETLEGQTTTVPPKALAPVLAEFLAGSGASR